MSHVDTCDKARVKLFCEGRSQECLPPTSDAVKFHIMRSHYQATIWNQAHLPYPSIPPLTDIGWILEDGQLKTPASFSSTDTESLSGDHFMFLYKRMPEQTLFLYKVSHAVCGGMCLQKNLTIITTTATTHLMKMSNIVACSAHTCKYFNENRGISFTGVLFWYTKCCFL